MCLTHSFRTYVKNINTNSNKENMKKLIIIIALIAVYGISVSGTTAKEMNSVKAVGII